MATSLHWVLDHQPLTLIIAVIATLALTGLLFYFIPKGFFPFKIRALFKVFLKRHNLFHLSDGRTSASISAE